MLDRDLLTAQERYNSLLREARILQRIKLARTEQLRRASLRYRLLDRLGKWLIAWGWRLRARYGEIEGGTIGEQRTALAK